MRVRLPGLPGRPAGGLQASTAGPRGLRAAGLGLLAVAVSGCVPHWGPVYLAPPARGIVLDGRTGMGVAGAAVRFAASEVTVRSGPDGGFALPPRSERRFTLRLPGSSFAHVPIEAAGNDGLTGFGWARQVRGETREPRTSPAVVILLDSGGAPGPDAPVNAAALPGSCAPDAESAHAVRLAAHLDGLAARPSVQALAREDPEAFRVLVSSLRERIQATARACALEPEWRDALLAPVDRFEGALGRRP